MAQVVPMAVAVVAGGAAGMLGFAAGVGIGALTVIMHMNKKPKKRENGTGDPRRGNGTGDHRRGNGIGDQRRAPSRSLVTQQLPNWRYRVTLIKRKINPDGSIEELQMDFCFETEEAMMRALVRLRAFLGYQFAIEGIPERLALTI